MQNEQESISPEATDKAGDEPCQGVAVIAAAARLLPHAPGVYRMHGEEDEVLYVGKAKNLKARVASYTRLGQLPARILRMVDATRTMHFIRTDTETEALLLEANLIKQFRPRFNVLLRDDKSFPYILISADHEAPQLTKHRGARSRKGRYFGPFASSGAVNRTLNTLQKAFLLRTCADSVYASRTRPCLLYQIKRCAGPCTGEIPLADYRQLVEQAERFLSGRSNAIRQELGEAMQHAAETLDFEQAALYRDRLAALSHVQGHQGVNPATIEEADVFALHQEGGQACVEVFFFRNGQNWGNHSFFPRVGDAPEGAALGPLIAQFYTSRPVPRLILLSHEIAESGLLAQALSEKAEHKVEIAVPQRGEKKDVVAAALRNAREALARRLAEKTSQENRLDALGQALGISHPVRRIEVYDNSHISGTNAVGAMIVSGPSGLVKNHYRTFTIHADSLTPGDDFAMMREVLTRRFQRLKKEHLSREQAPRDEEGFGPWPDLVIIDGGRGQLNAARAVLEELGLADDISTLAIAKGPDRNAGRERFFLPGRADFMLPERDGVLYFVQNLRDEAHRFAIGTHKARRKKGMTQGGLEDIPGIGATRKRALLAHFGTLKAIQGAAVEDLAAVPGINRHTAQAIFDYFQKG